MLTLTDPDHENFDAFLGCVLDDYTAETYPGSHDATTPTDHAAALQIEEVPPC